MSKSSDSGRRDLLVHLNGRRQDRKTSPRRPRTSKPVAATKQAERLAQPFMKRATASRRRAASETVSPSPPSGQRDGPGRLQHVRRRRARDAPAPPNSPSSVGPLMSEMIAGGAFHAISGRRRKLDGESRRLFIALNSACWCSSRCRSCLVGRAQVLARARQRERLLAVDVVGAGAQAQRVAAVAKPPLMLRDDAAAGVVDAAHRVDQLGEVFEVDFHEVVDRDARASA